MCLSMEQAQDIDVVYRFTLRTENGAIQIITKHMFHMKHMFCFQRWKGNMDSVSRGTTPLPFLIVVSRETIRQAV